MDNLTLQPIVSKINNITLFEKVDVNAMESQLNKNMKMMKTKERMRATVEANRLAKLNQPQPIQTVDKPVISDEELVKIFSTGEKVEKTPRNSNKKKKNKSKN